MGRKKKSNNFDDNSNENVIEKSSDVCFECPFCKNMLEMKNEMVIKKKGDCKCSCVPFSFKISKQDKSMNIDKNKDGDISIETDLHEIKFSWGKQITPMEDGTTLDTVKALVEK